MYFCLLTKFHRLVSFDNIKYNISPVIIVLEILLIHCIDLQQTLNDERVFMHRKVCFVSLCKCQFISLKLIIIIIIVEF